MRYTVIVVTAVVYWLPVAERTPKEPHGIEGRFE